MKTISTSNNLEGKLRDKVSDYLKTVDGLWYLKVYGNSVQRSGVPDFLICYKGKFIAIELKRPDGKGKLSPQQIIEYTKIRKANGEVLITNSLVEIKDLIEYISEL